MLDGAPKNWAPVHLCEEPQDLRLSEMRETRKAVKGRMSCKSVFQTGQFISGHNINLSGIQLAYF